MVTARDLALALREALEQWGEEKGRDSNGAVRVLQRVAVDLDVPDAHTIRPPGPARTPSKAFRTTLADTRFALDSALAGLQTLWTQHGHPEAFAAAKALHVAIACLRAPDENAPLPPAVRHPGPGLRPSSWLPVHGLPQPDAEASSPPPQTQPPPSSQRP